MPKTKPKEIYGNGKVKKDFMQAVDHLRYLNNIQKKQKTRSFKIQ